MDIFVAKFSRTLNPNQVDIVVIGTSRVNCSIQYSSRRKDSILHTRNWSN
jgi:hypothetical protein